MLLNENRNRVPLVASAPVDGVTPGKRGDMMMLETSGDLTVYVCTVTGVADPVAGSPFTGGSVWKTLTLA